MAFGGRGMSPHIASELAGLLGKQQQGGTTPGMDMKGLGQQAESLWKFLDDLAENDSAGYDAFLKKQAEAAGIPAPGQANTGGDAAGAGVKQQADTPPSRPVLVLATAMSGREASSGRLETAVLHIWAAGPGGPVIPQCSYRAPSTPGSASSASLSDFHLPLAHHTPTHTDSRQQQQVMQAIYNTARDSGILLPGCSESVVLGSPIQISSASGSPQDVQPSHQQQLAQHFHVLANAETLKLALAGTPVQLMPLMMEAVCQFIEASGHGLKLSRSDRVLQVLASATSLQQQQQLQEAQKLRHAHAAASGTSAEHLSDGLLSKLMSFGGGKPSGSNAAAASSPSGLSPLWSGKTASVAGQQKAAGGGARPRGPLIEELPEAQPTATRTTEMVTVSATPPGTCIQVMQLQEKGVACVRVVVHLGDGVSSAADVDIEVCGDELVLTTPTTGTVKAQLPCPVDDARAKAKFDLRRRVLTVTLPEIC